jgi:hypothetical protein
MSSNKWRLLWTSPCMHLHIVVYTVAISAGFASMIGGYATTTWSGWRSDSHVLRLGGFHTLSCFMSALGKIWATAGLRDSLVDSGVYAGCTVDQILQGKQFNRGHLHIVVYTVAISAGFASMIGGYATTTWSGWRSDSILLNPVQKGTTCSITFVLSGTVCHCTTGEVVYAWKVWISCPATRWLSYFVLFYVSTW